MSKKGKADPKATFWKRMDVLGRVLASAGVIVLGPGILYLIAAAARWDNGKHVTVGAVVAPLCFLASCLLIGARAVMAGLARAREKGMTGCSMALRLAFDVLGAPAVPLLFTGGFGYVGMMNERSFPGRPGWLIATGVAFGLGALLLIIRLVAQWLIDAYAKGD